MVMPWFYRTGDGLRRPDVDAEPFLVRCRDFAVYFFLVSSFYSMCEQDPQPIQVSVGVYDTAYEGQRAGEAFAPPKWQEPAKDTR